MSLYTRNGDGGMSSLISQNHISKSDDRFEVLGTIDELSSQIGLAKCVASPDEKISLSAVQKDLMQIMSRIADAHNRRYTTEDSRVEWLENEIDRVEGSFVRVKDFVLPGRCEKSARLDVARTVARRAERRYASMGRRYGIEKNAARYLNRLSDYLYILARLADHEHEKEQMEAGVPEISHPVTERTITEAFRQEIENVVAETVRKFLKKNQ